MALIRIYPRENTIFGVLTGQTDLPYILKALSVSLPPWPAR